MKRYNHLTKEQRYTISVCLRKKMSLSAIAKLIDVSKSTVSREIKKNSNMYRHYVAIEAQQFSEMRKKDTQETEETVKRGLAGHRAVSQESLVAGDYCRCQKTRGKDVCVD